MTKFKMKWLALAVSGALVAACGSDDSNELAALPAGDMLVLTATNQLISYDKTQPGVIRTSATISGIPAGFGIVGIDFRPRDGQLYAVARNNGMTGVPNEGRLFTINTRTGAATEVAILTPHPTDASAPYSALSAAPATFAVDFNPMADALRVISSTGQNLRVVLNAAPTATPPVPVGATFTDGDINGAAAEISGGAYTNSFDGTTSTRLLNINATTDTLTLQNPPNDGTQVVAAPLGVDATGNVAFDIDARNNRGLAVMTVGGVQGLYNIAIPDSTATLPTAAAASLVGTLNVPNPVVGLVLIQPAAPQAIALDGNTAGSQRLLKFGIRNPNAATATAISGLPAGERLLSIDYRPSNSTLYGLSSAGKIFTINPDTGETTLAVTLSVASNIVNGLMTGGKRYQIDFNPQADALRIVSSNGSGTQGENYRIPGTRLAAGSTDAGLTVTDTALTAGFNIASIAYTNSFANPAPTITQLFNADSANNRLAQQGNPLAAPPVSPNDGVLTSVGNFRTSVVTDASTNPPMSTFNLTTFSAYGGFDISGGDNGMTLMANRIGATGTFSLFTLARSASTSGNPTAETGVSIATASTVTGTTPEIGSGATASTDIRALTVKY